MAHLVLRTANTSGAYKGLWENGGSNTSRAAGAGARLRKELRMNIHLAVYSMPSTLGYSVCVTTSGPPSDPVRSASSSHFTRRN